MMRDGHDALACYRTIHVGATLRGNRFAVFRASNLWRGCKRVRLWDIP